jgi:predicted amidohydrolase
MRIAAAQSKPVAHNTEMNIQNHLRLIEVAAKHNVQLMVFPEMSLTGYEKEFAEELSFSENDVRLRIFQDVANANEMLIIVGAPIKIHTELYIGSFIFVPGKPVSVYTKQFLHEGEEKYFTPCFNFNPLIELKSEKISIAICADITNPLHPANANKSGATIYVASIFYTPNGIPEAYEQLSSYAKTYSMDVLMANYGGPSYQLNSAGKSAFWNNKGELIEQLEKDEEGLLIVEKTNANWKKITYEQQI